MLQHNTQNAVTNVCQTYLFSIFFFVLSIDLDSMFYQSMYIIAGI